MDNTEVSAKLTAILRNPKYKEFRIRYEQMARLQSDLNTLTLDLTQLLESDEKYKEIRELFVVIGNNHLGNKSDTPK